MQRRKFIKHTSVTLGAIALFSNRALAKLFNQPGGSLRMITKDAGIFTSKGGTILFKWNDKGIIVVDTQFPDTAGELIQLLKTKSSSPFKLLINTHHHADHTSGNIAFKPLMGTLVAHENAKKHMQQAAEKSDKPSEYFLPTETFTTDALYRVGKETVQLQYWGPAHTNGDALVHFQDAGIVHLGDLVFNRRFPYIDKTAGADISNWIKVLDKTVQKFPGRTKYVCGHAAEGYDVLIQSSDILAFRDYLGNALKFVEQEVKDGKIKSEILSATTIPGSPEWKGQGIERTLQAAYSEVTAHLP
ncbi:MAG: MBL fold metallo-hydrolase [Ferruginibacter sp.]|nr:MBL fold metallo-hydrolase [Ferruginibacter sp.]